MLGIFREGLRFFQGMGLNFFRGTEKLLKGIEKVQGGG